MCWKSETRLSDLKPDFRLTIRRTGLPPIITTPRDLMRQGRIAGFLTIDQVEFAFDPAARLPATLQTDISKASLPISTTARREPIHENHY